MTTRAMGALLPDGAQQENIADFSGGLNTVYPSHKIPTNFSPYMRNVIIDNGVIERSPGFIALGSTNTLTKVTGIFPYILEDGTAKFLVTDSSRVLQTQDFVSYTSVSSGSNTGSLLNCMQVRNKMWCFNGVDFVFTWDGTSKVTLNGLAGTPNVPKFKYGAYYQERVWGFSIPNAASDLYFTSVITTDAVIITPDDSRAWPAINSFSIGKGDGSIGTALWTYQGQLRAGKERSIYTVYGDNPTSYVPRREESKIGVVSNDSVVDMDGETHYLSQDGIYKNLERISDLIEPDVENMNKNTTKVITNSWDTFNELKTGDFLSYGTTVTPTGLVRLSTENIVFENVKQWVAASSANVSFTITAGDQTGYLSLAFVPSTSVASGVWPLDTVLWLKRAKIECDLQQIPYEISVMNKFTGQSSTVTYTLPNNDNEIILSSNTPKFTYAEALQGGVQLFLNNNGIAPSPCGSAFLGNPHLGRFVMAVATETRGQYISDIATNTSISVWGNLDSEAMTNGGSISYYYRTSTSIVNIATQVWVNTSPGGAITAPTQNVFVQWAASMTMISTNTPSEIDNVTISHIEGQSTDARAFAIDWKNRYWLAVSTTMDNSKRVIYVKSKITNQNPNAWMPLDGIPISCFARYSDFLYGGSASTGTVFRLDYGTNYNGTAIDSIYDTPDMVTGDNYFDKNLLAFLIDGEKYPSTTLAFQYSLNQRDFTSKSFSIDGTGRYSKLLEGVRDNGQYKTLRVRLQNRQLDTTFKINNLTTIYAPSKVLTTK